MVSSPARRKIAELPRPASENSYQLCALGALRLNSEFRIVNSECSYPD